MFSLYSPLSNPFVYNTNIPPSYDTAAISIKGVQDDDTLIIVIGAVVGGTLCLGGAIAILVIIRHKKNKTVGRKVPEQGNGFYF